VKRVVEDQDNSETGKKEEQGRGVFKQEQGRGVFKQEQGLTWGQGL